jgi:hypothetical protein
LNSYTNLDKSEKCNLGVYYLASPWATSQYFDGP